MSSTKNDTLGVAILGAGIFALEQHLPALLSLPNVSLKAIYSRSSATVHDFLAKASEEKHILPSDLSLYSDVQNGDSSKDTDLKGDLAALLTRADIHAVVIALPILVQPEIIKQSLLAGKHVLSEKPIAKDVATATELIAWYHTQFPMRSPIWSVAENFRFQSPWSDAAAAAKDLGGVRSFELRMQTLVEGGKYFETEWRKVPAYQGGFILDGGIHWIAALRDALGEEGKGEWKMSAHTEQLCAWLPPVDTVRAVVKIGKVSGTINLSFGSPSLRESTLVLECEQGLIRLNPRELVIEPKAGEKTTKEYTEDTNGVKRENEAWVKAILDENNGGDKRQSPEEGFADLEIVEKLLRSGEGEGERFVATGWKEGVVKA